MAKIAFSFLFATLFLVPVDPQTVDTTERKYRGLNGPIRTVRDEAFSCSPTSGTSSEKPWRSSEQVYDRQGNEIEQRLFNADGSVQNHSKLAFDDKGNVIRSEWEQRNSAGLVDTFRGEFSRTYTSSGLLKEVFAVNGKQQDLIETVAYDDRGNKILERSIGTDAVITSRAYKYDAENRRTEEISTGQSYSSKRQSDYDTAGHRIRERFYDGEGLVFSSRRTYDRDKLVEFVTLKPDGTISRTETTAYDKSGNVILLTIEDEFVLSKTTFEYYESGKLNVKDQVTVAKPSKYVADSDHSPNPGRILEKYNDRGLQVERLIYDQTGALYLSQWSIYDESGRSVRSGEKSSDGKYGHELVYEHDPYGNMIQSKCVVQGPSGKPEYYLNERKIITFYNRVP